VDPTEIAVTSETLVRFGLNFRHVNLKTSLQEVAH